MSFFRWSIFLWEWKRLQSRWMKAIIFRVFDHFANSPTNYCFFDTYLIVNYQRGEENCLLDVYILTRELYVFTRNDLYLCFGTVGKLFTKCLLSEFSVRSSSKKWYLRLYLTEIIQSNGKMLFAWRKNCLSKFLWCAAHV